MSGMLSFPIVAILFTAVFATVAQSGQTESLHAWRDGMIPPGLPKSEPSQSPSLHVIKHPTERLRLDRSVIDTPMKIRRRSFAHGLGTHSTSRLEINSAEPIQRFTAWVGIDNNERTEGKRGSAVFAVSGDGQPLWESGVIRGSEEARRVDIDCKGARQIELQVTDADDGNAFDHANWAEAEMVTADGKAWRVSELPLVGKAERSYLPFAFEYNGRSSLQLLPEWDRELMTDQLDGNRTREKHVWSEPGGSLRVTCTAIRYSDFPAIEWLLHFENTGQSDTGIVSDVHSADLFFRSARNEWPAFILHRTRGGTPDPIHFEAKREPVDVRHPRTLVAGHGRSSGLDFPFFKIDTGRGAAIIAVGWSGCWKADLASSDNHTLRVTAGLDKTHFRLHPGEKVRMPRMLALFQAGDETWEANARFRELIYKHYIAHRNGKPIEPMLFCNTCFTRGGGWLNETTAENQISLIKAYAPLGLEALLTDAGWFRGGWPNGAGNWDPRKDAYPDGMGPVAAAAKQHDMIYGLWFEPERVMAGTDVHQKHPEWLLRHPDPNVETFLLNFALPEVQDYFFNIVADFMKLPGFRFYRQDFNMDPLPYWRHADAPDRQGIAEMKYIEGLYAYWDRIGDTWPDAVLEECASGGHRIDLETVMRMHLHQKTDFWFRDIVDQASLWGMSQYLPNSTAVAHLENLTDYSFHSTMASSLCLGWIADAEDFDINRAKKLTDRYLEVRHLLVGAWYPLTPSSIDHSVWLGSQYHRRDLNEGLLLVFRREESPYPNAELRLRGLEPGTEYEVVSDSVGKLGVFTGQELRTKGLLVNLPERRTSDLIVYKPK
jgi:alpha-galactosidase